MAEPIAGQKGWRLYIPDPEQLPPEIRQRIEELFKNRTIVPGDVTGPPIASTPLPTEILFHGFDFWEDSAKHGVRLEDKTLRIQSAVLENIPAALRDRYRHLQGQTILPLELIDTGVYNQPRSADRIRVFGVEYEKKPAAGNRPATDDSLLPFTLVIQGVLYQRKI